MYYLAVWCQCNCTLFLEKKNVSEKKEDLYLGSSLGMRSPSLNYLISIKLAVANFLLLAYGGLEIWTSRSLQVGFLQLYHNYCLCCLRFSRDLSAEDGRHAGWSDTFQAAKPSLSVLM